MDYWRKNFTKFIELDDNKMPTHKISNPKLFVDIEDCENVGVLVPNGYVVLDIDSEVDSEAFLKLINKEYPSLKILKMKTTRGWHFWFKIATNIPNHIGMMNAYGITCDVRCGGKLSYVKVKDNDEWRDLEEVAFNEIDEIPKEFIPYRNKLLNEIPSPFGLKEGDGRRDNLFQRIIPLANEGFTVEQVQEIISKINRVFFEPSLNEKEITNLFTDPEIFQLSTSRWFHKGRFLHDQFAEDFHKKYNGVAKDGLYYIYHDGLYTASDIEINQAIIELFHGSKREHRNEVRAWLKYIPSNLNHKPIIDTDILCFKNGLYNLKTKMLLPHNPNYFFTSKIDTNYNKLVSTELIDKFLDSIAGGDKEIVSVLEEVMGYCLYPTQKFQRAFIAVGDGANGKSTWIDMIANMIGHDNISAIGFEQIGDKFKLANLQGKMLNIGEEMPARGTSEPQIFKKLISGDPVEAEKKGQDPFSLRNKAKLLFTCNELPITSDKSHGYYRRWVIIPFKQRFTGSNVDLNLINKLTTEEAKTACLNVALRGLERLLNNGDFTQGEAVEQTLNQYKKDTNSVLAYLIEMVIQPENLVDRSLNDLYAEYQKFCPTNGMIALRKSKFKNEMEKWSNHKYKEQDVIINKVKVQLLKEVKDAN